MLLDLYFHHEQGNAASGVNRARAYYAQEEFLKLLEGVREAEEKKRQPMTEVTETFATEETFREPAKKPTLRRRVKAADSIQPPREVVPAVYELLQELDLVFGVLVAPEPSVIVDLQKQRKRRQCRRAAAFLLMAA